MEGKKDTERKERRLRKVHGRKEIVRNLKDLVSTSLSCTTQSMPPLSFGNDPIVKLLTVVRV
jgi:hypothetical protein